MTVPTRFVKAKVDKYIQLYSKYGKNEGTTYDRVQRVLIVSPGSGYTTAPTLSFTQHAPGSSLIRATATCTISNGGISSITITNPGTGYTTSPTINVTGGGGSNSILKSYINISKRRVFEWDLENAIELNENGVIHLVDKVFQNADMADVYTFRLLDISSQSVINTKDKSGIPEQASFNQGKIIDIGYGSKTTENDIHLEIQPQTINKIVISVDEGISGNIGIDGDIEFYISLKITEKEPSVIEFGSLNNINVSQF